MEQHYIASTVLAGILALALAVAEFWYAGRLAFVFGSRSLNFLALINPQMVKKACPVHAGRFFETLVVKASE